MIVKTGDGKILGVVKDEDEHVDDQKTRKALDKITSESENFSRNGNNTESTTEAENK